MPLAGLVGDPQLANSGATGARRCLRTVALTGVLQRSVVLVGRLRLRVGH